MTLGMLWSRRSVVGALLVGSAACYAGGGEPSEPGEGRKLRPVPGCEGCEAAWERAPSTLDAGLDLASAQEPGERLACAARCSSRMDERLRRMSSFTSTTPTRTAFMRMDPMRVSGAGAMVGCEGGSGQVRMDSIKSGPSNPAPIRTGLALRTFT